MTHKRDLVSNSPEETVRIGIDVGKQLVSGNTVALSGELGAGKTLFTKGLCEGLGYLGEVTSPSYLHLHGYPHVPPIYHADFYLMRSEDEVFELGLTELFGTEAILIIEWAQRFPELFPTDCWWIELEWRDQTSRKIQIKRLNL